MFCPDIARQCVGKECRDWDEESQMCLYAVFRKERLKAEREVRGEEKIAALLNRLHLMGFADDPNTPEEIKQMIYQVLEMPASETTERAFEEIRSLWEEEK